MLKNLMIFGAISAVSVGGAIGIHKYNINKVSHIHTATVQATQQNKQNRHDIKNIKMPHIKNQVKVVHTHTPSLSGLQHSTNNKLRLGLSKAFNNCHNMAQFNRNKRLIKQSLGNNISSKILPIVKPQTSNSFSKPTGISNHLTHLYIGYGNPSNRTKMPVTVVLQYITPKYDDQAGAGGPEAHYSNKKVHYGNIVLKLFINIQTHNIFYQSGYNRIDN